MKNVSYIKHCSFIVDFLKIFLHNVKGLTSSGLKHLELNRFLLLKKTKTKNIYSNIKTFT